MCFLEELDGFRYLCDNGFDFRINCRNHTFKGRLMASFVFYQEYLTNGSFVIHNLRAFNDFLLNWKNKPAPPVIGQTLLGNKIVMTFELRVRVLNKIADNLIAVF